MAELGFAHDHAGEEGAERQRDAEQLCRSEGDAKRYGQHRQPEQFARSGMGDIVQDPGNESPADDQHDDDESGDLGQCDADDAPDAELGRQRQQTAGRAVRLLRWPPSTPASAGSSTSASTMARSSTISQPTAMRPRSVSISRRSCKARSSTTVEATESARPKTSPAPIDQPSNQARPAPSTVASRSARWRRAPRWRGPTEGLSAKNAGRRRTSSRMTPISASSLARPGIGDETGRVRPDQHAGYEIADKRRHAKTVGKRAEDESQPQTGDDGGDKGRVMRHCLWSAFRKSRCRIGAARSRRLLQYGGCHRREATRAAVKTDAGRQLHASRRTGRFL